MHWDMFVLSSVSINKHIWYLITLVSLSALNLLIDTFEKKNISVPATCYMSASILSYDNLDFP